MKKLNLSKGFVTHTIEFFKEYKHTLINAEELWEEGASGESIVMFLYVNYDFIYEALLKEYRNNPYSMTA